MPYLSLFIKVVVEEASALPELFCVLFGHFSAWPACVKQVRAELVLCLLEPFSGDLKLFVLLSKELLLLFE